MGAFFPKQAPTIFTYRDYKHYDEDLFRNEFVEEVQNVTEGTVDCSNFVNVCTGVLNRFAPLEEKYIRENNSPFVNKNWLKM